MTARQVITIGLLCGFATMVCPAGAALPKPATIVANQATLFHAKAKIAAKDKAYLKLAAIAKRYGEYSLKVKPVSVMDKQETPLSGDKHDYLSIARYWWPNPKTKDGLPWIRKDGQVSPARYTKGDAAPHRTMMKHVGTLARAWYFTEDPRFAKHCATMLRVWFLDAKTRMNPNVNYSQGVPGRNTGRCYGIIDVATYPELLDTIALLETAPKTIWTAADRKGIRAWFTKFLVWLETSPSGKKEAITRNNHSVAYDSICASIALFLGDTKKVRAICTAVKTRRVDPQIAPDGKLPHELARTKSWDYSIYNLKFFCQLARIAKRVDVDLWGHRGPKGQSIAKAVEFLIPYAKKDKPWTHKQISKWSPASLGYALDTAYLLSGEKRYRDLRDQLCGKFPASLTNAQ